VLFPTLCALHEYVDGGPLAESGLVCSYLHWPCNQKPKKTYKVNSSSCFNNLQHYNRPSALQSAISASATTQRHPAGRNQNELNMSKLVITIYIDDYITKRFNSELAADKNGESLITVLLSRHYCIFRSSSTHLVV